MRFVANDGVARAARRAMSSLSGGPSEDRFAERVGLVVSEMVANVIRHTGGGGCLSVWRSHETGTVRVEVSDGDPCFPAVAIVSGGRPRGRGLRLLQACCRQWGVVQSQWGKVVWAELERTDERSGAPANDASGHEGSPTTPSTNAERLTVPDSTEQHHPRLNGCMIPDQVGAAMSLTFIGEFDHPELDDVTPTLRMLTEEPASPLLFDLGGVTHLGLETLSALLRLAEASRSAGHSVRTTSASHIVTLLLHATGSTEQLGYDAQPLRFKPG